LPLRPIENALRTPRHHPIGCGWPYACSGGCFTARAPLERTPESYRRRHGRRPWIANRRGRLRPNGRI